MPKTRKVTGFAVTMECGFENGSLKHLQPLTESRKRLIAMLADLGIETITVERIETVDVPVTDVSSSDEKQASLWWQ